MFRKLKASAKVKILNILQKWWAIITCCDPLETLCLADDAVDKDLVIIHKPGVNFSSWDLRHFHLTSQLRMD